MSVEQSVEWELAGETEVLRENLSQCHFVHHKSHMTWTGLEPGRHFGKPATNHLSYGMSLSLMYTRLMVQMDQLLHYRCLHGTWWIVTLSKITTES
jgi:hypothetical protein